MSDYETSILIGTGAFGSVHLVRHKESQQIFAMKKMAKRNLDTPQKVEWAYLERDILAIADCPFVVSMLCSFPTKSHLCMVMEYVGGGDCGTLLSTRGPLSVPLARLYFAEAVLGVEYLHSCGVVHRDLKPDNLLITSSGHIKITDFGLSKFGLMISNTNIYKESAEDISREFQDREVCGTLYYTAPEVILKQGYGRPVDWWAMGIILHEFLLGCVPFDEDSLNKLYKNGLLGDIVWDCDGAPPLDAQNIITELLRTNPEHRLGTGGAFQIKDHPFLNDIDFDNLLSQKPEYVPQLLSDMDTSCFINNSDINNQLVSQDEEDTSVDNESLDFLNFMSSSERHAKLSTTDIGMKNDEDPKSPPECTSTSNTDISEMQKESVSVYDRGDDITILPSSSSLSDHSDKSNHLVTEDEEGKSKNEENIFFLKITSSESLSKHSTTTNGTKNDEDPKSPPESNGTMNDEDPKSPPECTPTSNTDSSEMQKESVPEPDRDNVTTILPSSSTLSEFPAQEERKSATNLSNDTEKPEKGKKRRGSIFRRTLASCRRGLSRAARIFACCYCCPRTI
ncbi:microtubule-associated serine/threonine-protein kinase 3-like [Dendrobates tinctorius]|uniref:microtubule-associated serine/threonine-protein kinase 3-like n=1 Tax=Dendrobates tinctorius TaxID=92724 RepID=UPI003CCA2DD7